MNKELQEYTKDVLYSVGKNSVSKEKFEMYILELEIIRDVKRKFMNDFKEVVENNKPTSIGE